jgi:hypothetical protein
MKKKRKEKKARCCTRACPVIQLYPIVHKRKDGMPVNDEVTLKIVSSIFLKHV